MAGGISQLRSLEQVRRVRVGHGGSPGGTIRQSRPNSGLGVQVKVPNTEQVRRVCAGHGGSPGGTGSDGPDRVRLSTWVSCRVITVKSEYGT